MRSTHPDGRAPAFGGSRWRDGASCFETATKPIRVVIAGGGTGGHVFPALALADQLKTTSPASEVLFIGSMGGLEQHVVPARGYPLRLLPVGKLRGANTLTRLRTLVTLPVAGGIAVRLLRRFTPHVVVGVGGYASGPVVLAAALCRLPIVLLEQNSIPGTTNRLLSHLANKIVIAFRQAANYFPANRTLLLGNPIRPDVLAMLQQASSSPPRQHNAPPCLLVLGGSQGARAINELMIEAVPALIREFPGLRVVQQTGTADLNWVKKRYQEAGLPARVEAFLENMGEAYVQADLVLSRSGATTLAELCVAGIPAVLIPYPFAADDHQTENAASAVEAGGAVMARQEQLTGGGLIDLLTALLGDRQKLQQMGQAMQSLAYPEAAAAVVNLLFSLSTSKEQAA